MDSFEFVLALIFILGAFVTIWVVLIYQRKDKERGQKPLSDTEYSLRELSGIAQSMNERIDTLEAILDAEVPDWREQHEH